MLASPLGAALPALLLSALILVPLLGKSFTIDDTLFLFEARNALADPAHPSAFEMTWAHQPERFSRIVPTGPVTAWLLVPCILSGGQEWVAHATMLVVLWAAALATVSLARRLGLSPGWSATAGLLLVATPVVLAMAGTAMPDVPSMALAVGGLERLLAWDQERRRHQGVAAAALLGLAPLARPHLALIFGIAALLLLAGRSARRVREEGILRLAPLLAAPFLTAVLALATRDPAPGAGNLAGAAATFSSLSPGRVGSNTAAFFIHWVLTSTFAVPWVALRWREMARAPSTLIAGVAAALLSAGALVAAQRSPWLLAPIAGLGGATLADALREGWRRRDSRELALACWLLLGLAALPYIHLPSKYLVASAPAAAVLVALVASRAAAGVPRMVIASVLVAGALLGLAILRADAAFSDVGRRAVAALIAPRVAGGERVWFIGRWGFQWYAENAGARPVTLTPPYPAPGEVVVVTAASARSDEAIGLIARSYPRSVVVGRLEDATPGGRIMNRRLGVGFYSNASGYWPWTWASSVLDEFVALQLWP